MNLSDANVANAGATYLWDFLDAPIGATPVLTGANTATPHFLTDADPYKCGSYWVRATVNGIDSASVLIATPLPRTAGRTPAFQERTDYNGGANAKGWHQSQTKFERVVDQFLQNPGPGAAGDKLTQLIWGGGRETHNSDTPLIVGAFALDPNDYALTNATVAFQFAIVAANGTTPLTAHAELYNLTDAEAVTSSVLNIVDATTPQRHTATLVVGPQAGKIKSTGEKVYECRIYLDAPAADPAVDTVELYKAEVRAVFTVTLAPNTTPPVPGAG